MDVQGKTVLIFGDSHSTGKHSPGYQLGEQLVARGGAKSVAFDAKGGRSAWSFFIKEDGGALLKQDAAAKPDVVIIILGTNDMGMSMKTERPLFAALAKPFQDYGAQLVVFGPPYWPDGVYSEGGKDAATLNAASDTVAKTMQQVYGKAFHDSRPLTQGIGLDGRAKKADGVPGVHFNATGAKAWATAMADAVIAHKTSRVGSIALGASLLLVAGLGMVLAWHRKHAYLTRVRALKR